ncbi:MAG: CbiX/SirB N-terminal domain-containing protein [Nitrososphaerota archaeon]
MSQGQGPRIGVVLVGHGELPKDIPREILGEYFELMARRRTAIEDARFKRLEEEISSWSRTPENDPYFYGLMEIGNELRRIGKFANVWIAFNEFCKPTLLEALKEACKSDVDVIVVSTVMLTRGGHHSEDEIPSTIEEARLSCEKPIIYVWPIDPRDTALFLLGQIEKAIDGRRIV